MIKAKRPYIYRNQLNFKNKPFDVLTKNGVEIVEGWYPRLLHKLMFSFDLPSIYHGETRLVFVQPVSLFFDAGFTILTHEVIPFIWDCWPMYYDKMERWLRKHKVKTAIFTSRQEMEAMKERLPEINYFWCPEGIDVASYKKGYPLIERNIDFLHYGREIDSIVKYDFTGIRYISGKPNGKIIFSFEQLYESLSNAKIVAAYPKSWTNPDEAGGIETLTQRFWECMLSRCVMIGHAPQELIDYIGYNPVIELDKDNPQQQLEDILTHIDTYQALVDKNRESALRLGNWEYRMQNVKEFLLEIGYSI